MYTVSQAENHASNTATQLNLSSAISDYQSLTISLRVYFWFFVGFSGDRLQIPEGMKVQGKKSCCEETVLGNAFVKNKYCLIEIVKT